MKTFRAIVFWFAVSVAAVGLSGAYAWLNDEAPSTPTVWRQS